MTVTWAIAGKGGTGKTTFSALAIQYLIETGRTPVLAIDGDPSSNLNLALGLKLRETIGQIREETASEVSSGTFRAGISKPDWFEYKVNECLIEGDGVDLLAMGRPEGPGCYCAANNMLRRSIDALGDNYAYVVVDNEAGMEHISRQTTRRIDTLFVVSDPTYRGLGAVEHIVRLTGELGSRIGRSYLVINKVEGLLPDVLHERAAALGIPLLGVLPRDPMVAEYDMLGRPFVHLGESSLIYPALRRLLQGVLA